MSLVLPLYQLQALDENDTNISVKNIIDKYAARPDKLENTSLADFAADHTFGQISTTSIEHADTEHEEETDSDSGMEENQHIILQNGLGMMR